MITLYYDNQTETYDNADDAIDRIRELERLGYLVDWTCIDSEDNDYIWQNV